MPDTPGTLNFPTSLDTAVSLFEVSNRAYTTMTGSIGTGDLSIGVANGSLLPSTGAVTLVDSLTAPTKVEHIIYTVNSSNTLTVPAGGRAFGGSTAQSWSGTVYVRARALAQHHSVLRGGVIALETKLGINSSTPSSGTILRGTGAGASDWGALVNADVSASAAIAMSKLAALTASRAVITDVSGVLSAATTTSTEIGYLNGVTSAIQTQIDGKQASDADLTAIAGLSPSNDDIIQRKAGAWTNRTPTQLTADLIAFTGDSGSGGVKGLVPAPSAGDAAASKFLKADGTWATAGGGGLTVGTTAIASGTAGRFLYETSGNVLGEVSTLTSDGTILTFSPTVTTGTGATSGLNANANSLTTGDAFNFASSSVSSGNVFKIAATGTAAASNTKTALNVATSGANGTGSQTTYGAQISNTSTGSGTNIALNLSASGGTNNTALNVSAGQTNVAAGTASLPGLTFAGDTATGLYRGGGNQVWLSINTTPTVVWLVDTVIYKSSVVQQWSSGTPGVAGYDLYMRRNGVGDLGFGSSATSATPAAQTISNQGGSGTNTAGATFSLVGSLGTSQGAPGVIDLKTGGLIAASGTTAQTAVSRTVLGATKVLANNTTTTVTNVTVASNTVASGLVGYTVEVFDGTDVQLETGEFVYAVTNKGGTIANNTITSATGWPKNTTTSGTLTVTWAISAANPALLSVNANSSLTPSTGYPRVTYTIRNLTQQAIAIQ